jgi:putative sigma-54 modulation protein
LRCAGVPTTMKGDMLTNISMRGVPQDIDADLQRYVNRKLGRLDIFLPRRARRSTYASVRLIIDHAADKKESTCEVTVHLPQEKIMARETTVNMYAAVDIVEARLRNQIKRYKSRHRPQRAGIRTLLGKLHRT